MTLSAGKDPKTNHTNATPLHFLTIHRSATPLLRISTVGEKQPHP
jgi:hypothetical protein